MAARAHPSDVSVAVARSAAEVESVRDVWQRLHGDCLTSNLDYHLAVVRTEPAVVRPHVLVARREEQAEAVLVGRLETIALPCRLGYRTVLSSELRAITIVYGGLLGAPPDGTLAALVGSLRRSLSEGEADVVVFRELRVGSTLHRAVRGSAPALLRDHGVRRNMHRELVVPRERTEFVQSLSKSTRDGVKRYRNKLQRELGDRLDVRIFREPAELEELVAALDGIARKSWQGGLGTGFRDDPARRERTRLALERGWLRACVVYVDGRAAAFWQAQGCGGRLVSGIPGFDPAFASYRIGTYALVRLIEELCDDPDVTTLDFGFGDAEYKRRFGTGSWEEQTVTVFAPRLRPLAVNAARSALAGMNEALRRVLERAGLVGRVRGAWRRGLAQRAPARLAPGRRAHSGTAP